MDDLFRKYIDMEVKVEFDRREYADTQSQDTKRFRVIGVHNEDADDLPMSVGVELLSRELQT
ncbi:hypothetical protein SAMN05421752_11614 [Natronorubrum thiooxidans]|uniref:Uncharacterized protein n=1 Tax=Natronorubrum thiooxidans TaxID=308853 RepID=A0A1N7GVZ2_9EURY|nr:hypothetical protein SAMN05421752_11614 [Natronorubrum thiooxidans]